MFRALVSIETKTELLDAAQTLKLRSVDQPHHQLAFIGISLETNDVVNWIAIDAFRHCANINRQRRSWSQVVLQDLHDFSGLSCKISNSFPAHPHRCLRLIFLDFPIFLDLNRSLPLVKSPNT